MFSDLRLNHLQWSRNRIRRLEERRERGRERKKERKKDEEGEIETEREGERERINDDEGRSLHLFLWMDCRNRKINNSLL